VRPRSPDSSLSFPSVFRTCQAQAPDRSSFSRVFFLPSRFGSGRTPAGLIPSSSPLLFPSLVSSRRAESQSPLLPRPPLSAVIARPCMLQMSLFPFLPFAVNNGQEPESFFSFCSSAFLSVRYSKIVQHDHPPFFSSRAALQGIRWCRLLLLKRFFPSPRSFSLVPANIRRVRSASPSPTFSVKNAHSSALPPLRPFFFSPQVPHGSSWSSVNVPPPSSSFFLVSNMCATGLFFLPSFSSSGLYRHKYNTVPPL